MPRRFIKACNQPGCPEYTREPGGYCPQHKTDNQVTRQQESRGHKWYSLSIWSKVKRAFRMTGELRAHICQYVVDPKTGEICGQPGTIIDHKIPFGRAGGDAWFLFLGGYNFENLQSMCQAHHNKKTVSEGQPVKEDEYADYE